MYLSIKEHYKDLTLVNDTDWASFSDCLALTCEQAPYC